MDSFCCVVLVYTKERLQLAQERVANLDESLHSMTTEKEDAMVRAATAEEQNAKMGKDLCSAFTRLDVSACTWVGWGCMHLHIHFVYNCVLDRCVCICVCMIDVCMYMHVCVCLCARVYNHVPVGLAIALYVFYVVYDAMEVAFM